MIITSSISDCCSCYHCFYGFILLIIFNTAASLISLFLFLLCYVACYFDNNYDNDSG